MNHHHHTPRPVAATQLGRSRFPHLLLAACLTALSAVPLRAVISPALNPYPGTLAVTDSYTSSDPDITVTPTTITFKNKHFTTPSTGSRAVEVYATTHSVVFEHCQFSGEGRGVSGGLLTILARARVEVKNCNFIGYWSTSSAEKKLLPYGIWCYGGSPDATGQGTTATKHLKVDNCQFKTLRGGVRVDRFTENGLGSDLLYIRQNRFINIDGRYSNGAGAPDNTLVGGNVPHDLASAIQVTRSRNVVNGFIWCNEIIQERSKSSNEDLINLYLTGGKDFAGGANTFHIQNNLIRGGWGPATTWNGAPLGSVSQFNGVQINLADGDPNDFSAYGGPYYPQNIYCRWNSLVSGERDGIALNSGKNVRVEGNLVTKSGYYWQLPGGDYTATPTFHTSQTAYPLYGITANDYQAFTWGRGAGMGNQLITGNLLNVVGRGYLASGNPFTHTEVYMRPTVASTTDPNKLIDVVGNTPSIQNRLFKQPFPAFTSGNYPVVNPPSYPGTWLFLNNPGNYPNNQFMFRQWGAGGLRSGEVTLAAPGAGNSVPTSSETSNGRTWWLNISGATNCGLLTTGAYTW